MGALRDMRIRLFLILLFTISIHAQPTKNNNFFAEVPKHEFSSVWTATEFKSLEGNEPLVRPDPLGYIGANFQRFYIHFISVIKDSHNPYQYFVYGKTKVKSNICTFQGILVIEKASLYDSSDESGDRDGRISGKYLFYENPKGSGSGYFEGRFDSEFFIGEDGLIQYNGKMMIADGFSNNLFEGNWVSYSTGKPKTCNWGDFRIPNSRRLDSGASEFGPSSYFTKNGWEDFEPYWERDWSKPIDRWWITK